MKRLFNIAIVLLAAVSVVGCKNFNTLSNGGKIRLRDANGNPTVITLTIV